MLYTRYRRVVTIAHPWMIGYFHYLIEALSRVTPLLPELRQFKYKNNRFIEFESVS